MLALSFTGFDPSLPSVAQFCCDAPCRVSYDAGRSEARSPCWRKIGVKSTLAIDMAFRGDELFVACQGDASVHVIDTPKRVKLSFQAGTGWVSLGFF